MRSGDNSNACSLHKQNTGNHIQELLNTSISRDNVTGRGQVMSKILIILIFVFCIIFVKLYLTVHVFTVCLTKKVLVI